MDKINGIIYETAREVYNVGDKLSIASLFLFCWEKDSILFAELLYTDKHTEFIERLNGEYSNYGVDFTIKLHDVNIKNAFYKTIEKIKEVYDKEGYYKALYMKDEFALAIQDIY